MANGEFDTSWMREVNDILKELRFRDGNVLVRFLATAFPKPTIAIAVYEDGEKIFERPIQRLADFIEDLKAAAEVCRNAKTNADTTTRRRRRRARRQEAQEEREEQEEQEEQEEAQTSTRRSTRDRSRSRSSGTRRRRAPARD